MPRRALPAKIDRCDATLRLSPIAPASHCIPRDRSSPAHVRPALRWILQCDDGPSQRHRVVTL